MEKKLKNRIQWAGDSNETTDVLDLFQSQESNLDFWTEIDRRPAERQQRTGVFDP